MANRHAAIKNNYGLGHTQNLNIDRKTSARWNAPKAPNEH